MELETYKKVNLDILSWPDWKIKAYNDNFTDSEYAKKVITYKENLIAADILAKEERYMRVCGVGNSMTPILKSKQTVIVSSYKEDLDMATKGDIVFCKVNGHFYLHKVYATDGERFQIGNNHGHINGWTNKKNIFAKVIKIL